MRFDDVDQRDEFQAKLEHLLKKSGVSFQVPQYEKENALKKLAITKSARGKLLERFVRITFSHVSILKFHTIRVFQLYLCDKNLFLACSNCSFLISQAFKYEGYDEVNVNAKEAKEILEIELTPLEFGEAMGMKPSSMFVESMFNLMDKVLSNYAKVLYFVQSEPTIHPKTCRSIILITITIFVG